MVSARAATVRQKLYFVLNSASLRLGAGFAVLFCVFAIPMVMNLYTLADLDRASEAASAREEIVKEVRKIGEICGRMDAAQKGLIASDGNIRVYVAQLQQGREEIRATFSKLLTRPLDEREQRHLMMLFSRTSVLSRHIFEQVVPAKQRVREGLASPAELAELEETGRDLLQKLERDNQGLVRLMELKTGVVADEARRAREFNRDVVRTTLVAGLLLSALAIFLTHRAIMRPINQMVAGTKALGSGNLDTRLEMPRLSDFRNLAESFNRMAQGLQAKQRQLIEAEKLATLGRFAAGVAHEINNPVAVILGYAKTLLGRQPKESPMRDGLEAIEEEARHCEKIISGLLDFARPGRQPAVSALSPAELVAEVIELSRVLRISPSARIDLDVIDRPVALELSRARLRQVVLNIVTNALDALGNRPGGQLRIEGRLEAQPFAEETSDPAAARALVLKFIDNGPGIPEEHLARIYEPFFTTKGDGTGLGLTITYGIVEAHGGQIEVESRQGEGTTFTVRIPAAPEGTDVA